MHLKQYLQQPGQPIQNDRIAFVSNSAWSVFNFRLDVIEYLLESGYRVLVMAPEDEYAPLLEQAGCEFVPIGFDNKAASPLRDLLFYRQLQQLYKKYQPGFIFHYVAKPNIYGSLAAATQGIPSVAVVTGLGYPFARRNWLYWVMKNMYRKSLKKAREVWFLNNDDARIFINDKVVNIEKVKVLPGEGVNTEYFSPMRRRRRNGTEPFVFLMSTRLLKSKGIGLYADAARILRRKNYHVRFELIGLFEKHHPDSIEAEDLARWEAEGLIRYRGFVRDVRSYLSEADCFIFPSFYNEGVPRCLMEAASVELPVITSRNRGCKEVVMNNVTGFLCNMKDPFDLADKMERMIELPDDERRMMGQQGRQLVMKKFDVRYIVDVYMDTLGNHPE